LSAGAAAMGADYTPPGPAAGKNAAVEAFIQYAAFKAYVTCAAFLPRMGERSRR
jgi:hypothetical protein